MLTTTRRTLGRWTTRVRGGICGAQRLVVPLPLDFSRQSPRQLVLPAKIVVAGSVAQQQTRQLSSFFMANPPPPARRDDSDDPLTESPDPLFCTDFFDEPITNFQAVETPASRQLLEAMDHWMVTACTLGMASTENGGDSQGLTIKAAHAVAISWGTLIRRAQAESCGIMPMVGVLLVAPLLTHTDPVYLYRLDRSLGQITVKTSSDEEERRVQLRTFAEEALRYRDDDRLSLRERYHLVALEHLLRHEREEALRVYWKLLQSCPGDVLGLSLFMQTIILGGHTPAPTRRLALDVASSVSSYWRERNLNGHALASAWMAVGRVLGGSRMEGAERMSEIVFSKDARSTGALVALVRAHVYYHEGRSPEGISLLANSEAQQTYEKAGFMFSHGRIGLQAGRFLLDREADAARRTLSFYDEFFREVIYYSNYHVGSPLVLPKEKAPATRSAQVTDLGRSMFSGIFAIQRKDEVISEIMERHGESNIRTIEDILCWLPPTPMLIAEATFLLLRITMSATIRNDSERWTEVYSAWETLFGIYAGGQERIGIDPKAMSQPPMVILMASMFGAGEDHVGSIPDNLKPYAEAMQIFGDLYWDRSSEDDDDEEGSDETTDVSTASKSDVVEDDHNTKNTNDESKDEEESKREQWKKVVNLMTDPKHGRLDESLTDLDACAIVSHIVSYAAMESRDLECLLIARSVCSQGVSLRMNSPEEWFRYSVILDALGDEVAAEKARHLAMSLGRGEGVRPDLVRKLLAAEEEQFKKERSAS